MLLIFGRFCLVYFVAVIVSATVVTFANGGGWFFALKTWKRLALFGSLILAVMAGVAIEVRDTDSRELTFEAGSPPWPSTPIRVYSPPGDGYTEEVSAAVRVMNRSVGCDLFAEEGTAAAAQVRVRAFDGMPCGKPFRDLKGSEAREKKEGTWDCHDGTMEVLLNNPADFQTAFRGAFHGLGHVVRLAHDETGLMTENVRPLTIVAPNDKDVLALQARYCPAR